MSRFWLILLIVVQRTYAGEQEMKLLDHLLKKSSALVRPVRNRSQAVVVTFGFTLVQIVALNEHEQSMTMKIWLRMRWVNEFMNWIPKEWGNLTHSRVHPSDVWTPDVFLEEDVGHGVPSGINSHKTPILIYAEGEHVWMLPVKLQSACGMDVTKFPFDQQKCKLKFTPWTHNKAELDIVAEDKSIVTSHYVESSEWTLISVKRGVNYMKYVCCPHPYVNIEFVLTLRRKPLYYIHNLVIPCILQMTIILSTFLLPLESGERVGVVITILLVFAVYLQVLSESLPESSSTTPVMANFFIIVMGESACLLIATSFILKVHFKGMEKGCAPVSCWVRQLFLVYFARLVCVKKYSGRNTKGRKSTLCSIGRNLIPQVGEEDIVSTQQKEYQFKLQDFQQDNHIQKNDKSQNYNIHVNSSEIYNSNHNNNSYSNGSNNNKNNSSRHHQNNNCDHNNNQYLLDSKIGLEQSFVSEAEEYDAQDAVIGEVKVIKELICEMSRQDEIEEEYQMLAKVLNRLFFIVFLISYMVSSCTMLLPAYIEHLNMHIVEPRDDSH